MRTIKVHPLLDESVVNYNPIDPRGADYVVALNSSGASMANPVIPLEDCKCPICLDYFIDVVETRCHHKFCNFCLENWLRASVHRQCPTCRSIIIETIPVKPELQEIIDASIQHVLSEEIVRERLIIRSERQSQVQRFSADREQTQALLARIAPTGPRARYIRSINRRSAEDGHGPAERATLLSEHMNWWDDDNNRPASLNNNTEATQLGDATELENLTHSWLRQVRRHREFENNVVFEPQTRDVNNPMPQRIWNMTPSPSNSGRNNQPPYHRRASSQFGQSYHENLMEEYSYHLRRVNSAHTRIREAYRDFNYHNGRMQEILQEHRSFFSDMRTPRESLPRNDENHVLTYEDFENLLGAEMGELLDNSPAAQVVFGRYAAENGLPSTEGSTNFHGGMHPHNNTGRRMRGNSVRFSAERFSGSNTLLPHLSDVLGMEHEIQNRGQQLNRLSSLIRQCPWNSDSRFSRSELSSHTSHGIPNSSTLITTTIPFSPAEREFDGIDDSPRQSSAPQHRMVETGTEENHTTPAPAPRRARRRITRNSHLRPITRTGLYPTPPPNGLLPVQNSYSDNALVPAIVDLRELGVPSSNNTGDVSLLNAQVNPIANYEISSSTNSTRTEPSSSGWVINDSTDSEEEQSRNLQRLTRRNINRSPIRAPRTMSVPPRRHTSFRRALRFHRRRLNILNNQNTDSSTATAPASSPSNTNVSNVGIQNDDFSSNIVPTIESCEDENFERLMDLSEDLISRIVVDLPNETFHRSAPESGQ